MGLKAKYNNQAPSQPALLVDGEKARNWGLTKRSSMLSSSV